MATWPVQDAKARFSELLDKSVKEGPQIVTKRGVETAVLVPIDEWRRLKGDRPKYKDIKEWLLAPEARFDFTKVLPARRKAKWRKPVVLE